LAEKRTGFKTIKKIQMRVREKEGGSADALPDQKNQFFVELDGDNGRYFVPVHVADKTFELEMINVLREAFFSGKSVSLGYRKVGRQLFISAVWLNR
jgi:hypothetical protein